MQYKKTEIIEKINKSALKIFAEKGYKDTKISDIGVESGVSVGNIYRYYKSKEEIFSTIVPENFLETLKKLLYEKISVARTNKSKEFFVGSYWIVNDEVIQFMMDHRQVLLIVLLQNKGTKFENAKDELIDYLVDCADVKESDDNTLLYLMPIIYDSLIQITLTVLRETRDIVKVKKSLEAVNKYHMFGITNLLK